MEYFSKVRFPLKDVSIRKVRAARKVKEPLYADAFWQMNQSEFAMQVEGVGEFYAKDGKQIEYSTVPGVKRATFELYLNGSVYGAILHQRQILPLHGSSFRLNGQGIMICGNAGAGKSSLTASFCLQGANFMTDDVTPIVIQDNKSFILPLSDRIKLWGDTLNQLGHSIEKLDRIDVESDKFYLPVNERMKSLILIEKIFIIEINESGRIEAESLNGAGKFAALRNEIYRLEYLQGMPENEKIYFENLVHICNNVQVTKVKRPKGIKVKELVKTIGALILNGDI